MRNLTLLAFALFLFSCSGKIVIEDYPVTEVVLQDDEDNITDSAFYFLMKLAEGERELLIDSKDEKLIAYAATMDSLIEELKTNRYNELKLHFIADKLQHQATMSKKRIAEVDSIMKVNKRLENENNIINSQLKEKRTLLKDIEQDAKLLRIAGLKIKPFGLRKNLLSKPELYETTVADKVKNIKIDFVILLNRTGEQEFSIEVKVRMYSTDGKHYQEKVKVVRYNGAEQSVSFVIDEIKHYSTGSHAVHLYLNDSLTANEDLTFN
jgi:hypothetical protein